MNLMLTAVLAKGRTILHNAAVDPEVVDLANLLNLMGGKIKGAGTRKIVIDGVKQLHGCKYRVIPDRLIAASLLMTVGIAGGKIKLNEVIPEHLESCIQKLKEIGMEFTLDDNIIVGKKSGSLQGVNVKTGMYPAFATDIQQPLTSLLLSIDSKSTVTDLVYKNRFAHVPQLKKMGADITVTGNSATIKGGKPYLAVK